MTSYLHLHLSRDRRSLEEVCRLRLGRLLALGLADCTLTIGHAKANSAQLRASRLLVFDLRKGGPVAPGPTVSNRTLVAFGNRPYTCLTRPSCSPIGPSLS